MNEAPLILRFYEPPTTEKFQAFCRRSDTPYSQERDYERGADVFSMSFENKSARSKFISAWSRASIEVIK